MEASWNKVDVIHHLADTYSYRSYLEVCTPTTGGFYRLIDRSRFPACWRLMYDCPADFDDGLPVDFRERDRDIRASLGGIKRRGLVIDLALVDSWHEYDSSWRDISAGCQELWRPAS